MIAIEFEHIKLQLITEADLEQMRQWRNDAHVLKQMEHQEIITESDHFNWYRALNKDDNFYFKILVSGTAIGIINLKNIDWNSREGEAGIFIGNLDFSGTLSPMLAVFIFMKMLFNCVGFNKLYAKIGRKNSNALEFNKKLGYKFLKNINQHFDYFVCSSKDFNASLAPVHHFTKTGVIRIFTNNKSSILLADINPDPLEFEVVYS